MDIKATYEAQGYVMVDNFLSSKTAESIYQMYVSEKQWEQQDQVRENHFQHVFKTHADCLPRENEKYIAKFGRSKHLEKSPAFNDIYDRIIKPRLSELLGISLKEYDTRCYRLLPGDLYRTHIDDYAGDVGMIYYVNKRWVWDWGGILHVCQDNDNADLAATSILPKFNRAILVNHKVFRFPHFISSVESFALEPRYTIISFNR